MIFTPMFKSGQLITCSVSVLDQGMKFFCSFMYALNFVVERLKLWADLRNHHSSLVFQGNHRLIMGDFNEVAAADEHSNYPNVSVP